MAGGTSRTTTQAQLPPELQRLTSGTGERILRGQELIPIEQFTGGHTQRVAPLNARELALVRGIGEAGSLTGPNPLESRGISVGAQGLQAAQQPTQSINVAERGGLSTLEQLGRLGETQLAAPRSDQQIFGQLGRAGQISQRSLPGITGQERQALGALGEFEGLAGQDLSTLAGQEREALGQLGQLGQLNQQDLSTISRQERQALGQLGQLGNLNQQNLETLSGQERQALGQLGDLGQLNQQQLATFYGPEFQALSTLQPFVQGQLGESPATRAALAAYEQQAQPALQSQLALRGLERSGAGLEALTQSRERVLVPLIQQELEQRFQAVPLLQQLGGVQGAREREDVGRQLQTGLQLAGQTAGIGAAEQARQREDIGRQLTAGLQIAGQTAEIGGLEQARQREDINRQLGAFSQLATQLSGLGNTLAQRDIQTQAQQFGQASQLGQQYQDLSQLLGDRQRQDLARQIATQQEIAGQQFGLGQTIGARSEADRAAEVAAAEQQANLLAGIGNQSQTREFAEQQAALQSAGLPRELRERQLQNEQQDFLRRQALAEQLILAPVSGGVLTSGVGQSVGGRQSGLIPGVTK